MIHGKSLVTTWPVATSTIAADVQAVQALEQRLGRNAVGIIVVADRPACDPQRQRADRDVDRLGRLAAQLRERRQLRRRALGVRLGCKPAGEDGEDQTTKHGGLPEMARENRLSQEKYAGGESGGCSRERQPARPPWRAAAPAYSSVFFRLSRPPRYTPWTSLVAPASLSASGGLSEAFLRLKEPLQVTLVMPAPPGRTEIEDL